MPAEPAAPAQQGRALVVDDEMLICMLVESILMDAGYAVVTANSVAEALATIDADRIDFAVVDVNLKGQSAYPIAEKLASARIPFVFATGAGHGPMEFPDRPWIAKPFNETDLLDVIGRLTDPAS